ncbi:concanavalin A-like lectin/glucanase domain-containing protein [Tribonema minus]|uniref:Concanavalin A-like lectin/glucanase domain-containing protein n=1 Tax=Tribonema minus TaxID=303371 RepID=A0A836CF77_9STRA|nr:concanavalin A-like lectin/glucanase domain-containing protein [Tribonema minus]
MKPAINTCQIGTNIGYNVLYGHIEFRMKVAKGTGTWPSVYMLPVDWYYGDWPQSGEIDIFEAVNEAKNPHASQHDGGVFNVGTKTQEGCVMNNGLDYSLDYHIYTYTWTPGYHSWSIDGKVYCTVSKWLTESPLANGSATAPYDRQFQLMFNLAIGGSWPECCGAGAPDPQNYYHQMLVDYVRVYALTDAQKAATRWRFPNNVDPTPSYFKSGSTAVAYNVETAGGNWLPLRLPNWIDAESFDIGGQGVGYFDTSGTYNSGNSQNRPYDGMDLNDLQYWFPVTSGIKFKEQSGAYVTSFVTGEWVSYTVYTSQKVTLNGGAYIAGNGALVGLVDSTDCAAQTNKIFEVSVNSGDGEDFQPQRWSSGLALAPGTHRIVVCAKTGGVNFTSLQTFSWVL